MDVVALIIGVALGLAIGFAYAMRVKSRGAAAEAALLQSQGRIDQLEKHNADLTGQNQQQSELKQLFETTTQQLQTLSVAASDADRRRAEAEQRIQTLIEESKTTNANLSTGVQQLVAAMAKGQSRGRWGEMQLEQLLRHSGLEEGANYSRQDVRDEGALRPDLVVFMPGGGEVLIDSKFPWDAYFEAMGKEDAAEKLSLLQKHAKDLGARVNELSKKQYTSTSNVTPDFVVLFLPLEPLLSTALDHDGLLLETAFGKKIIIATPTTMLGLLRTISFAWSRHDLAVNAEKIRDLGAEMLNRLGKMVEYFNAHGKNLRRAIDSYNDMLSSFDSRVVKQAERMQQLGVPASKSLALEGELANDVHHPRTAALEAGDA
jgi:DNA recombination protein RmuC